MTARHLVVGLDGADLDFVETMGAAELPHLFGLMERGCYARLDTVKPAATLPNWTTFLTGVDPGVHGVFDFTVRKGYRVQFTGGTIREAPTIAARLDRAGHRCACVGFPATWPPERLEHGVFISGWDSPVAFEADQSFVWPPALYDDIVARFGAQRFDDVDEFQASGRAWYAGLGAALEGRVRRKTELGQWLLGREPWDLFAIYFGESDTAAHHLWSLGDSHSPRHPRNTTADERGGLRRVYRALDAALGALVAAAGDDVEVTLLSDHGSGGSSDKVLYLNRALRDAGLLQFRPGSPLSHATALAKRHALPRLGPRVRDLLFRAGGRWLPGLVESHARFGAIDMKRTVAFSDELNYFPAVHLNVIGREPAGTVAPGQVPEVCRRIEDALHAIVDPFSGRAVVAHVWRREELFRGPFMHRAPDLILELSLDNGYSYNLQPSATAPPGRDAFRRLAEHEYLGKKGRSLPGSHRAQGLLVASGPSIAPVGAIEAHIADVTATLLSRMGVAAAPDAAGRVLFEALAEGAPRATEPLPEVECARATSGDESLVVERLRALGYVD